MDFDYYIERARETATYPNNGEGTDNGVNYTLLGIGGESGELLNKWKKYYRDHNNDGARFSESSDTFVIDLRESILDEAGDVLWYLSLLCDELGTDLASVAQRNLNKLQSRSRRGTIGGSGDTR